ncbi:hypothetical protein CVT25_008633 [Psilocybe cyanescens]|uniref:Uncharacterized protein n=1 Tax=Psilocybe cyanescens TaxID=93625 RepID=A0A409XDF3_PSICY|nr:hypothetical protein CVT25_008633 [Psilocybe cyanescens]
MNHTTTIQLTYTASIYITVYDVFQRAVYLPAQEGASVRRSAYSSYLNQETGGETPFGMYILARQGILDKKTQKGSDHNKHAILGHMPAYLMMSSIPGMVSLSSYPPAYIPLTISHRSRPATAYASSRGQTLSSHSPSSHPTTTSIPILCFDTDCEKELTPLLVDFANDDELEDDGMNII